MRHFWHPPRIYVKSLLALHNALDIHALAHITGGGLLENIPRVLPVGTKAVIDSGSWERPTVFRWLQEQGNVLEKEMLRTFNCGVGMVVCIAPEDAEQAVTLLQEQGETVWQLGRIETTDGAAVVEMTA